MGWGASLAPAERIPRPPPLPHTRAPLKHHAHAAIHNLLSAWLAARVHSVHGAQGGGLSRRPRVDVPLVHGLRGVGGGEAHGRGGGCEIARAQLGGVCLRAVISVPASQPASKEGAR